MGAQKSKRNSLIELYRFLFAMWAVYYHGYFFLPKTVHFSNGRIAVDFFFILTGLFLMNSVKKSAQMPLFKGLVNLAWKKVKPLGVTLIISLVFAQIYFWINLSRGETGGIFGYMWYVEWLVLVPLIYCVLYKYIRNKKGFYLVVAVLAIVAYVLQVMVFEGWGFLRALVGMGIGILLSLVPKNNWQIKNFNVNWLISIALCAITIVFACFCAYIPGDDHIFILILFPSLLYFATCVDAHIPLFDYLGGLSFSLYAYQTICRVLEQVNVMNENEHRVYFFLIIAGLSVIDDLIKRLVRKYKTVKKEREDLGVESKTQEVAPIEQDKTQALSDDVENGAGDADIAKQYGEQ